MSWPTPVRSTSSTVPDATARSPLRTTTAWIIYGLGNAVTVTSYIPGNEVNNQGVTARVQFAGKKGVAGSWRVNRIDWVPTANVRQGQYQWCPISDDHPDGACWNETEDANPETTYLERDLFHGRGSERGSRVEHHRRTSWFIWKVVSRGRICLVFVNRPVWSVSARDVVKIWMEFFETQPDRTDLPLVVMPVVIESMIGPFKQNFTMLENVARVRMYEDFTLDEDTIVERCKDADAVMVIGFHCADAILDRLDAKCYAFGGTGVASYINLENQERGIRVCNVLHYGDHAVAEHAMALLMELTRHAGALDMQVKQGDWDGADGFELFGKKLGIIGLGGIGQTVAGIANAFGMKVSAWNSHVPAQVFENLNVTPVEDMNELISNSDVVSVHMPF